MNLASFITQQLPQILSEWEAFARTLGPVTDRMSPLALRDHARPMLERMALDLRQAPRANKVPPATPAATSEQVGAETAASIHGMLRQLSGFSLPQMTAEMTALRATVLRLWLQGDARGSRHASADILGFNQFLDLALVDSAVAYAEQARVEGDRLADAAKQAALLNALPAQIGLLDSDGGIVAVNHAWRQFGSENALRSPGSAVGINYLDVCDRANGEGSEEAAQAATGIRAVLAGATRSFLLEYPCHSKDERRWFQMRATRLGESGETGAVIVHVDVTEQKLAEESLRESERRFVGAFENAPIGMSLVTPDGRFVKVNRALCDLLGYSEQALLSKAVQDVTDPADLALDLDNLRRLVAGEIPCYRMEKRYLHALGHPLITQLNVSVIRDDDGEVGYFVSQVEDIAERKEAERLVSLANDDLRASEAKVKRLNHVYAVLSQVNAMIARARGRDELFREVCRIAVEVGDFSLAWVGQVDRASMCVSPVASMSLVNEAPGSLHSRLGLPEESANGDGPAAAAAGQQLAFIANELATDARVPRRALLVAEGFLSMACLPIVVSGEAVAVLTLCAGEAGYFDEAELKLLGELAVNIAFALESIDRQHRLDYLAYYDDLTGLANRALFLERIGQQMRMAVAGDYMLGVCLVDIERFRNVNDSLGRAQGDTLLKQVGAWLGHRGGDPRLVARLGVDHFALLLPNVDGGDSLALVLEAMAAELGNHAFALGGAMVRVTVKMGVALYPADGDSADLLLQHAEAALKRAKATGENHLFYSQAMGDTVAGKLTLENQLRRALDRGEFELHYQPKVSLATGELTGAEALIRWNDADRGLVPPGSFIPMLEETGLIHEVGRWALRKAIEVHLGWLEAGLPPLRIAVNVSALQLRNRGFAKEVVHAVAAHPHAAAGLELEITESMVMGDIQHGIACLQAIRAVGVTIALDDFGTGFSSLSYLSRLPMDTLKIDRSFINEMTVTREGLALVSTIITLAHSLKHKVVAEGVETDEQSRLLRLLGCDEMQGFVFGRPVPREAFEALYLLPRLEQSPALLIP